MLHRLGRRLLRSRRIVFPLPGRAQRDSLGRRFIRGQRASLGQKLPGSHSLHHFPNQYHPVFSRLGRSEINPISCLDPCGGAHFLAIDFQLSGNSRLARENHPAPIYFQYHALSIAPQKFPIGIAVHHQNFQYTQLAAPK